MKFKQFTFGLEQPLFVIAGPDTLESEAMCLEVAGLLKETTDRLGMPYIFKGSFDKANRTSLKSYRGPGLEDGLKRPQEVREVIGRPVANDVQKDKALEG